MSILDAQRLVAIIEGGRRYGSMGIDDNVLDQFIEKVREEKRVFSSESPTVTKLGNFIAEPLTAIKSEYKALFNKYDLFVLPEDICLCMAEPGSGTHPPSVVLSMGMVNLIGSTHFAAHVDALIPAELNAFFSLRYPQFPVANLFTTLLFLFRYRYFRYAEPMPDFSTVIAEEKLGELKLMIAGAVTAMLLHELGHHELGHLDTEKARSMVYDMVVFESLSDYQRQEAEADHFALDSVIAEASPLISYWLEQNLDFFIQLELMTGIRDKYHPLAINRALNAGILRQDDLSKFGLLPEDRRVHGERLAQKFLVTENAAIQAENQLAQIGRESCFDILADVAAILKPLGTDLAPLLDRSAHFDCFEL
jgi:hypothetical protein